MTDTQTAAINRALDNHDHLKKSYFWSPASNASGRRYDEKRYSFKVEVVHELSLIHISEPTRPY